MATASISGLVSGLDTASIIDQLMQLETVPQNKLKTNLGIEQTKLKNLQALNAKVAALTTQAQALAAGTGWGALTATSSSTAVSVSTTTGTASGSFTFTVGQTAAAHRLTFASTAAGTDVVVSGGTTVKLTQAGVTQTLDTGDGSLDGLVTALNGAGTGVSAAKVKLDDGSYRLVVNAAQTGAAGAFTLTNADGSDLLGGATVDAGRDAAITIGPDTIHSATNTFSGVIPGVDLTVSSAAVGTSVDVTVAKDTASVTGTVKSLVDSINATLAQIDSLTAYNPTTKTSGPLAGDAGVRALRNQLLNAIYPADGTSIADVGIQTDRYGKLVFDEATFSSAYAADPARVAAKFTSGAVDGFAARVASVADAASNKYSGTITAAITGRGTTISRIQDSIDDWDQRLELRRTTLQRTFTALETALSKMNSQSSWLSGQLSALGNSQGS
jgi:flagellar hook-associated protein 2